jgi:hypothetical protein
MSHIPSGSMSQPEEESKSDMMSKPEDVKVPAVSSAEATTNAETPLPAVTETSPALETGPTDSHALATADHEDKGTAQIEHLEPEVKDLGWDKVAERIPAPLVGGLPNEELWILVRRFNHVLTPSSPSTLITWLIA